MSSPEPRHAHNDIAKRPDRRQQFAPGEHPAEAPVALSHVVVTVTETGTLDVTVDSAPFPPPPTGSGAWTRGRFSDLLDAITADRTGPIRVEVRESDGTVFTDIIRFRRTPPEPSATQPETKQERHSKKRKRTLVEVAAEGFVSGEDVAVAVIVTHTVAGDTGVVRALLDRHRLPAVDSGAEVVLHGHLSGATRVRRVS